jgi:hypothetical protein
MKTLALLLGIAAFAAAQPPQAADDPQSLAAVRNAVTRLNGELQTLSRQVSSLNASTDKQFAGLQTALVPVGAVIDWYRPSSTTPVPAGFMICNGDKVNDAQSPMNNVNVPNLIDKFVMGVTPARQGETGGNAQIPPGGGHGHGIHFSGYATGEINYGRGPGRQDQFQMQYAADPVGNHDHGGENRPPFFGLIKLIRVR